MENQNYNRPAQPIASLLTFNRTLSKRLSHFFVKINFSPNGITTLSLLAGITAGFFMGQGRPFNLLEGAFFIHLSFLLDDCDGEVARLRNLSSVFGMWYDYVADFVVDVSLWLGLAMGAWKTHGVYIYIPIVFALCVLGSAVNFRRVVEQRKADTQRPIRSSGDVGKFTPSSFIRFIGDDADPSILIWLCVLTGRPEILLIAGCVYINFLWASNLCVSMGARKNTW